MRKMRLLVVPATASPTARAWGGMVPSRRGLRDRCGSQRPATHAQRRACPVRTLVRPGAASRRSPASEAGAGAGVGFASAASSKRRWLPRYALSTLAARVTDAWRRRRGRCVLRLPRLGQGQPPGRGRAFVCCGHESGSGRASVATWTRRLSVTGRSRGRLMGSERAGRRAGGGGHRPLPFARCARCPKPRRRGGCPEFRGTSVTAR
jgi:hypothetical protein